MIIPFKPTTTTLSELGKIPQGTVNADCARRGLAAGEPMTIIFDRLLVYAQEYENTTGVKLSNEAYLSDYFTAVLSNMRKMLSWSGALGPKLRLRDSIDSGMLENIFWKICEVAGINGNQL